MTKATKVNPIDMIELEFLTDDLHTLATLWNESSDSKEVEKCRYYIGNQMVDKIMALRKLYQSCYGEDGKLIPVAA